VHASSHKLQRKKRSRDLNTVHWL